MTERFVTRHITNHCSIQGPESEVMAAMSAEMAWRVPHSLQKCALRQKAMTGSQSTQRLPDGRQSEILEDGEPRLSRDLGESLLQTEKDSLGSVGGQETDMGTLTQPQFKSKEIYTGPEQATGDLVSRGAVIAAIGALDHGGKLVRSKQSVTARAITAVRSLPSALPAAPAVKAKAILAEWRETPDEGDPMVDCLLGVIREAFAALEGGE